MTAPQQDQQPRLYSFRNLARKNPFQISSAVFAIVNVFVAAKLVTVNQQTLGAFELALFLVLGLFVASNVDNKALRQDLEALASEPEPEDDPQGQFSV